jgi:hypothetical protein
MKLTSKFETVAVVGYSGAVSRDENRAAHGAVCLLQARRAKDGLRGRRVNSNGRHCEIGESFELDTETLDSWERIAKQSQ